MSEKVPQPGEQAQREQALERTPAALDQLLTIAPDADRRTIETVFTGFVNAVRGDANRLDTEDLVGFEQKINSLFGSLERGSNAPALPEIIRNSLRRIPEITRGFLAGVGKMGVIEGLKQTAAQEWYMRRIVETLEALAKKADEYRIEKELAGIEQEMPEISQKLEEITQEREEHYTSTMYPEERQEYERLGSEIETLHEELGRLEELKKQLEEQRILQDEPALLEYGLLYFGSRFAPEERAALQARLQELRAGSAVETSSITRPLERRLAGLMQEAHRLLEQNSRALQTEFLQREWQGRRELSPELKNRTSEFFHNIFSIYGRDLWPEHRRGEVEQRNRIAQLPEDIRALLTIYKINERPPTFLHYRRWLPLPFHPNNKVFLAKAREALLLDITNEKIRQFIVNPDMETRVRAYQEMIGGLGPYLEIFLAALNSVRGEKGKGGLNLGNLEQADSTEVMQAISRSRLNTDEIFAILHAAKEALGRIPVRESAVTEVERTFPPIALTVEDQTRWQEQIIWNVLREADTVGYKIRSGGREIWAKSTILRILRDPQSALNSFREQMPEEEDPARALWQSILDENRLQELIRDAAARTNFTEELEETIRRLRNQRPELERERDALLAKARNYQHLVSSRGGRNILGQREERSAGRTGRKEKRLKGKEGEWQFREVEDMKELEKKAKRTWGKEKAGEEKFVPIESQEEMRNIKEAILELRKLKLARGYKDKEEEKREEEKFGLLLSQAENIMRITNYSAFRIAVRSFQRHLETAGLDEVSQEELARRLKIIEETEKKLKGSKLYGEATPEAAPVEAKEKKKKKGKKGDKKKRGDELVEGGKRPPKLGKQQKEEAVRKAREGRKKK